MATLADVAEVVVATVPVGDALVGTAVVLDVLAAMAAVGAHVTHLVLVGVKPHVEIIVKIHAHQHASNSNAMMVLTGSE